MANFLKIVCLDGLPEDNNEDKFAVKSATMTFEAETPQDAMEKLLYTLNLRRHDPNAKIQLTKSGKHLFVEHFGKTYGIAV